MFRALVIAVLLLAPAYGQSVGSRISRGPVQTPHEAAIFKCLQDTPTDTGRGAPWKNEEWRGRCIAAASPRHTERWCNSHPIGIAYVHCMARARR